MSGSPTSGGMPISGSSPNYVKTSLGSLGSGGSGGYGGYGGYGGGTRYGSPGSNGGPAYGGFGGYGGYGALQPLAMFQAYRYGLPIAQVESMNPTSTRQPQFLPPQLPKTDYVAQYRAEQQAAKDALAGQASGRVPANSNTLAWNESTGPSDSGSVDAPGDSGIGDGGGTGGGGGGGK